MASASEMPPVAAPPPLPVEAAPPPLPLEFALYEHKEDSFPVRVATTWEKFARFIVDGVQATPCTVAAGPQKCIGKECRYKAFPVRPVDAKGSRNYMAWSPVSITGDRRLDVNVKALTLLSLDFDHVNRDQARQVVAAVAPYAHVRHTTHNHRSDDICFRIILRLSRPVIAHQWHRFLRVAIAYLGVTIETVNAKGKKVRQPDPTCKNRSRIYYTPSYPNDGSYDAGVVEGKVLDVDMVLAWADANIPPDLPRSSFDGDGITPEGEAWDLDGEAVQDAIDAIGRYMPDKRRHELALALGGMLRARGCPIEDARYILFEGFKLGGSQNPEARANTVDHTWSLDGTAAMTGFNRVCDILARDEADEIGALFTDAAHESFLRGIPLVERGSVPNLVGSQVVSAPPPVAPVFVDLKALRDKVASLANKRGASFDRDDKIQATLLRRVLAGKPVALPGGYGDVETVREGAQRGVGREKAVLSVASTLGFALPARTPWDAVAELVRVSLAVTQVDPGRDWLSFAQKAFERAQTQAEVQRREEVQRVAAQREALAALYMTQAAAPPALPPSVPPSLPPGVPPASAPPAPPLENWEDKLTKSPNGTIASTLSNLTLILENDPRLRGTIVWNDHDKRLEVRGGALVQAAVLGATAIVAKAQDYLVGHWGITCGYEDVKRRIMSVAYANKVDPLREKMLQLVWDGVPRVDTFLIRYFGADDTEHTRRISRRWMLGALARAFEPGCKFDNVLVFEGIQGKKKTTALEALGLGFYCSTEINLRDKDAKMLAACSWLVELAELDSIRKNETTLHKSFFTTRKDKFRAPFGDEVKESPRRCVFCGTTNETQWHSDPTGGRRYWAIKCHHVDMPALLRDAPQLWAEAVTIFWAYRSCPDCAASEDTVPGQDSRCERHRWWLDSKEELDAAEIMGSREEDQPWMVWKNRILVWWRDMKERPTSVTAPEIAVEVGDMQVDRVSRGVLTEIGIALRRMGFIRRESQRDYVPNEALRNEPHVARRGLFSITGGKK
jgi:putative DNA primase/helicase